MYVSYKIVLLYFTIVTGYAKTIPNCTRTKIQYCWTLKLHSCTTVPRNTKHMARWPSLLSQMAFCWPVRPLRCTTGSVQPVNGINKDVSGTRLLPTTVSTYPVDWACSGHLLCPNGRYNQPLATHLHTHPTPPTHSTTHPTSLLPTHLLLCVISVITVVVKKVAQNLAVLASCIKH